MKSRIYRVTSYIPVGVDAGLENIRALHDKKKIHILCDHSLYCISQEIQRSETPASKVGRRRFSKLLDWGSTTQWIHFKLELYTSSRRVDPKIVWVMKRSRTRSGSKSVHSVRSSFKNHRYSAKTAIYKTSRMSVF